MQIKKTSKDILRVVLGLARQEGMPACSGSCLERSKDTYRAIPARLYMPHVPRGHEAQDGHAMQSHLYI